MQGSSEAKKPWKSILKSSNSFERPASSYHRKNAKFDELNVMQTLHSRLKIEEPKKLYYTKEQSSSERDQVPAEVFLEKLRKVANAQTPDFGDDKNASDEEFPETDEEKVHRIDFERRRKAHYKEYEAVKLARKLIEEEFDGEEVDSESFIDKASESTNCENDEQRGMEENGEEEEKVSTTKDNTIASNSDAVLASGEPMVNSKFRFVPNDPFTDPSHPCYGKIHRQ